MGGEVTEMSNDTIATPAKTYPRPSGYTGKGPIFLNDKSVYGMRFACGSCGGKGSGYGGDERGHSNTCPTTQHIRDERARRDAVKAEKASAARAMLASMNWDTVSDDAVIRMAEALTAQVAK